MAKINIIDTVRDGYFKLKTYWKRPPRGYDVSYKEFVNLSLGYGGLSFLSVISAYTTITASVVIMVKHFGLSSGLILVLSLFGSLISLIRAPILSMIIDNANSKNGGGSKFKPFLLPSAITASLVLGIIAFVPSSWNDIVLFTLDVPAMPLLGITEASSNAVGLATLVMFILVQLGQFAQTLFSQSLTGIEQTISTVAQERANIGALRGLICNIPSSIMNIVVASILVPLFTRYDDAGNVLKDGWADINVYRIVFPICAIGAIGLVLFTVFGTKERVVVHQKYVAKVSFIEGAGILTKSKYFWILCVFNFAVGLRGYSVFTSWIQQYSFTTPEARAIAGVYCTTLLMTILVVGMLVGPLFIKKFGKKKVLLTSSIAHAVLIAVQLACYKNPVLLLIVAFFQNLFNGFHYISGIMVSDILDDLQYKTGKRLEGFWQNYSSFITTILGFITLVLAPVFLSLGGIGLSEPLDTALRITEKRDGAYFYYTLLGLIGGVLAFIPLFFYDLTEKKHAQIIKVLRIRAACDNLESGELTDTDVLNVKGILDEESAVEDIVTAEIQKHQDEIERIIEHYEEAKARTEETANREGVAEFLRELELEDKRVRERVIRAESKAKKKGEPFDEESAILEQKKKCRYYRLLTGEEFSCYRTYAEIVGDAQSIYLKIKDKI